MIAMARNRAAARFSGVDAASDAMTELISASPAL
jgi:hypothetical protein